MLDVGQIVVIISDSLHTIRGKSGRIVRQTTLNANDLPGYIVEIEGRNWTLYAEEVEAIGDR